MDRVLNYISAEPFDDYAIKEYINKNGIEKICDWTGKKSICILIDKLAYYIEECLLIEYKEALAIGALHKKEKAFYKNCFPGLSVDSSQELLFDLLIETPKEVTDFIAKFLSINYWTPRDLYSEYTGGILIESWEEFTRLIKHKVRFMFFSNQLKRTKPTYEDYIDPYSILDEIGKGIKEHQLLITYQPQTLKVFRARQHSNEKELKDVIELGSPPENAAQANRFSPAGIPMFYCAFDSETAIIEILDFGKTNETISIGEFINLKTLNLIDLSKLDWISIFDEERRHLRESAILLRQFVSDLSSPISNDGSQHIEYIPTQVVTEYLKNSFTFDDITEIHGMIYPSSKRKDKSCIVLFFNQDHLTQDNEDKLKYLTLNTSKIKKSFVKDISVSISFDNYFGF